MAEVNGDNVHALSLTILEKYPLNLKNVFASLKPKPYLFLVLPNAIIPKPIALLSPYPTPHPNPKAPKLALALTLSII